MIPLWFTTAALAAPLGNPLVDVDETRAWFSVRVDNDVVVEVDRECVDGDDCGATWRRSMSFARVDLGGRFGGFVELGRQSEQVTEAGYQGVGPSVAVGFRSSVRVKGDFSMVGQVRSSYGVGSRPLVDETGQAKSISSIHALSALAAVGDVDEGVSLWLGPQVTPVWYHRLQPLGQDEEA
ncbi:MAG: hypothetical protein QGG40_22500, partial [Myxococcota bacterium]|nr:hypothetical protein [Myxococcota bacterium]